jgi:hypothetical protein
MMMRYRLHEGSDMSKRYTVTSTQTPHGPIYQILDKVTGAVIESAYRCEKWAEREAERMEDRWKDDKRRKKKKA